MKKNIFIYSNEWNLRKLTIKQKDQHTSYTTKSTRGTMIILTKWYLPPVPFLKINLSLLGNVWTEYITSWLSTNDVLPLCKVSRKSIKPLNRHGWIHWWVSGGSGPPSPALEFQNICKKIYKNCLDYLLNLAIVRIPLEKKFDPPIIEISLARSNLYEIAVKS